MWRCPSVLRYSDCSGSRWLPDLVRHLVNYFSVGIEELNNLSLCFPERFSAIEEDSPFFREEVGVGLVKADAGVVCCVIRDPDLALV